MSAVPRVVALLLSLVLLVTSAPAETVTVTFEVTVPDDTPRSTIHIAGDFQGWNPGSADHALAPLGDGRHVIDLPLEASATIAFKFTRGSWASVEKGPRGEELANRTLVIDGPGRHAFTVARWADDGGPAAPPRPRTVTGHVIRLDHDVLDGRPIWVYLPPGYETDTDQRYPVLYMLDGQNVFDAATSFAGEWTVDEILERDIRRGTVAPVIVVAIANAGGARAAEYTPWPSPGSRLGPGGRGDDHLIDIVTTLKPLVDGRFRTMSDVAHTGFAGSSLGGLMALYAAGAHADVFGRVAALSPSIWWKDRHILDVLRAVPRRVDRLYADLGGREADHPDDARNELAALETALRDAGYADADLLIVFDETGRHHETAWARRLPRALAFLFPPQEAR